MARNRNPNPKLQSEFFETRDLVDRQTNFLFVILGCFLVFWLLKLQFFQWGSRVVHFTQPWKSERVLGSGVKPVNIASFRLPLAIWLVEIDARSK